MKWLKSIFSKAKPFKLDDGHTVVPAFKAGGIQYYALNDLHNIYCERAFAYTDYHKELSMCATKDYLQKHLEASDKSLDKARKALTVVNNTIDIDRASRALQEVEKLNMIFRERLEMIVYPELLYKCGSIVFFDEHEDPYTYDWKYAYQKIEHWKQCANEQHSFFFAPLMDSLRSTLGLSGENLDTYMKVAEAMNQNHSEFISTITSGGSVMNAKNQYSGSP